MRQIQNVLLASIVIILLEYSDPRPRILIGTGYASSLGSGWGSDV